MNMKTRAGITLIEVLVAIFIMGVGMLAILVLFPVAALSMARAIRDDRASQCGQQAAALANTFDLRHDTAVLNQLNNATLPYSGGAAPQSDTPSYPVYIDPFGATQLGKLGGVMYRVAPSTSSFPISGTATQAERWFTLLDDINFLPTGKPSGASPERYGYYSWAYIARRPQHGRSLVDLTVLVYKGRSVSITDSERAFPSATTAAPTHIANSATLTITVAAGSEPELRPGGYILDTTYVPPPPPPAVATGGTVVGRAYQILDIQKSGTTWQLRMEQPQAHPITSIVVMENVIAAFEKGTGWRP